MKILIYFKRGACFGFVNVFSALQKKIIDFVFNIFDPRDVDCVAIGNDIVFNLKEQADFNLVFG